jgi:tetratricopeptide (TPR) repeat protein
MTVRSWNRVLRGVASLACIGALSVFAEPADNSSVRRYFEEGERALAEHRYAEAQKAYEKLRELDPGSAEIHAKLGIIYFQQGKFQQAVPALRQALKLKPGLPNANILLAMSLSELGHYSEALPGLEKGFRGSTDSALKRMSGLQLERAYTGLGRDSQAVEVALELNRLYPNDPEVLYHSGRLFGNFAYLTMSRLAQVAPNSVWRHQGAAEAYESQGSYDMAIGEYRQVLAMSGARPGIHYRLGRVLLARARQGDAHPDDLAEASREFARELEVDPTNANAAYELAEIHRRAAEFGAARDLFAQALKYYPDFEEAQVGMGRVLLSLDQPALAVPYLERAVSLDPRDEVPFYQLAQGYGVLGNAAKREKALAEFRRLRSQKPRQEIGKDVFSSREVTKQELDPNAAQ